MFLLVALATLASAEIVLNFGGNTAVSINTHSSVVHTPAGFFNVSIATTPVCGSVCRIAFVPEEGGNAVNITAISGNVVEANSSAGSSVTVEVMWCTPGFVHPNSTFFSVPYTQTRNSTTIGRLIQGACPEKQNEDTLSLSGFDDVAVGESHACAVHKSGTVYCWGTNSMCQLGSLVSSSTPYNYMSPIPWFTDFIRPIKATGSITCAGRINGDLVCWGSPVPIPTGTDCTTYQYGRMVFDNVSAFAISDTLVAAISGDNILLSGVSGHIISANIDEFETPNHAADIYPAWGAYPTIKLPSKNGGLGIPGHHEIHDVVRGSGNSFVFLSKTATIFFSEDRPKNPCALSAYPSQSFARPMRNVVVCSQPDISATGILLSDTYLYVRLGETVVRQRALVNNPAGLGQLPQYPQGSPSHMFTAGATHVCMSGPRESYCVTTDKTNKHGVVPATLGVYKCEKTRSGGTCSVYSADASVSKAAAGGYATCTVTKTDARIHCYGRFGTGVVHRAGDGGNGINGVYQPQWPFTFEGTHQTTHTVHTDTGEYQIKGAGGCNTRLSVSHQTATSSIQVASRLVSTQISPSMCVQTISCSDRAWNVDRGPFPVCVSKLAAGDYHTCILSCEGVVMCTGTVTACQYTMAEFSSYHTFSRVWMGSAKKASAVYASGNLTCIVAESRKSIYCTGAFPTTQLSCNTATPVELVVDDGVIDQVAISPVAVCVVIKTLYKKTVSCIGDPESMAVGTLVQRGVEWSQCIMDSTREELEFPVSAALSISPDPTLKRIIITSHPSTHLAVIGRNRGFEPIDAPIIPAGYTQPSASSGGLSLITPKSIKFLSHDNSTYSAVPYGSNMHLATGASVQCVSMVEGSFYCIDQTKTDLTGIIGTQVRYIARGANHTVVLADGNMLCCSGSNARGQCGRLPINYSTDEFVCIASISETWPYVARPADAAPVIQLPQASMEPGSLFIFMTSALVLLISGITASIVCAIIMYRKYAKASIN